MEKIKMTTPLVEMDGDEMTRILWKMIKDELLLPFVDLKTSFNHRAEGNNLFLDKNVLNQEVTETLIRNSCRFVITQVYNFCFMEQFQI